MSMSWVAVSVTVQRPVAPTVSVAGHASTWTVGGGGDTVMAEVAVLPLSEAVTVAIPRMRPVTEIVLVMAPAGTVTRSPGRPTIAASPVLRSTSVGVG
ncbi:MAG TPA: hypothetical protein VLT62_05110 [Candidatus Methylomirabilis sp.]|nr:hypothetical protein [Candidatus Methylomirabilis sp.]